MTAPKHVEAQADLNATIAKLSYMVNGEIGRDWRTGRPFVLAKKGDEFAAIRLAVRALQQARSEIARLRGELATARAEEREACATDLENESKRIMELPWAFGLEALSRHYIEFAEGCACCEAWKQYDVLRNPDSILDADPRPSPSQEKSAGD